VETDHGAAANALFEMCASLVSKAYTSCRLILAQGLDV